MQGKVEAISGLGLCDDSPCYKTIIPGKTSWSQAVTIINGIPGVKDKAPYFELTDQSISQIFIPSVSPSNVVKEIDFFFEPSLTAQDVVAQLGYPCHIRVDNRGGIAFVYPNIEIALFTENFVLKASSPTVAAMVPSETLCEESLDNLPRGSSNSIWQGFTRYVPPGINPKN